MITSRSFKVEELAEGTFVIAPSHVWEDLGGGHSKLRYPEGTRVPMAEAVRLGLVTPEPEGKKVAEVEDKKAPAPANKARPKRTPKPAKE